MSFSDESSRLQGSREKCSKRYSIHGLKKQIPLYSFVHIYISKPCNLRYVKTGSKNVQLVSQHCWETSRIAMFCVFPPTNQTCLAANQVVAGCEELLQKAERSSTFCNKVCICCAFYRPQGKLATSNITPIYGVTAAFIIHSEVSIHITQIAANQFVLRLVWSWEVKPTTSLFNSSCCNIAQQVARFVACFTVALITVCLWCIYVVLWEHAMNVHQADSCWRTSVFCLFFR